MKKACILIFNLVCIYSISQAQNGYIVTTNDSIQHGYLRLEVSYMTGIPEIELWKTKKDTAKVLVDFTPFLDQGVHVPYTILKTIIKGKLNLYSSYRSAFMTSADVFSEQ